MNVVRLYALIVSLLGLSVLAAAVEPIQVAVITGGHDFETEFWFLFKGYDDITITRLEQPAANRIYTDGTAKKFDVIVLYDMAEDCSEEEKNGMIDYINSGKGLIVLHHALVSYQDWPVYAEIIGGTYIANKEGKEIAGKKYPASSYAHDEIIPITVVDTNHPITQGVLPSFTLQDECYDNVYIHPAVTPLLKTTHPGSMKTLAWTKKFGKGEVCLIQCGHDRHAFYDENYRKLVINAIRWAAKEKKEKNTILSRIQLFDQYWSQNRFDVLHDLFAVGSTSYPWGEYGNPLIEFSSHDVIESVVKQMHSFSRNGYKEVGESKDIKIHIFPEGNQAVATSIWEAQMSIPGAREKIAVRQRVTMVFEKRYGTWKIIHYHNSPLGE